MISHQLTTARRAVRIVVLTECIVEQGSHAALLAAGGAYARLSADESVRRPAIAGAVP